MSNIIGALTGANAAKSAAQAANSANTLALYNSQQQEGQAQSAQGVQLKLLAAQQATTDNSAAALDNPSIGRTIMGYNRRTAATLGG